MAKTPVNKQKNRRYRNAKISEYKLKKLVENFAKNVNVKDCAIDTKLTVPTVGNIYHRLRETLFHYGGFQWNLKPEDAGGAQPIWGRKHRGAPQSDKQLLDVETLFRVLHSHQIHKIERLNASDPKGRARAIKLYLFNQKEPRYNLIELLKPNTPDEAKEENTRPFSPHDCKDTSVILVNEKMKFPEQNFFNVIWNLLLKHPL